MVTADETEALGRRGRSYTAGWIAAALLSLIAGAALLLVQRHGLEAQRERLTEAASLGPRVLVAEVRAPAAGEEIRLPATVRGYVETAVYAKVAGYLKTIRVDKGDAVRKGQLLAVLESPELDHQVAEAFAHYQLALTTDQRDQKLHEQGIISAQAADNSHASLLQARAAYQQLLSTQDYEQIKAPMDGIVTARLVDPGALIPQATAASSASTPIVTLAAVDRVRVYAHVPQDVATRVENGAPAIVTVSEYPGRKFEGTVTRHTDALDATTRTMLVEVDLPNPDAALLPGMYATLQLRATGADAAPRIPDDALIFRDGKIYAPLVRDDHIHLAEVTLGADDGREVEITAGVQPGDLVAISLGQAAEDGDPVQPLRSEGSER